MTDGRHEGAAATVAGLSRKQRRAMASQERARRKTPARIVHIMPLEPRIMMDATLDLGVDGFHAAWAADGGGTAVHDAVSDLIHLAGNLTQQVDAFAGKLTDALTASLGDLVTDTSGAAHGGLFAGDDQNQYVASDHGAIDDVFANLHHVGNDVGEAVLADLRTTIEGTLDGVKATIKGELTNLSDTNSVLYKFDHLTGVTDAEKTSLATAIGKGVDALTYDDLLDPKTAFANILDSLVAGERQAHTIADGSTDDLTLDGISAQAATLGEHFIDLTATAVGNNVHFDGDLDLVDSTGIKYTTVGAGNHAVEVNVALGKILPNLDGIFSRLGIDGDTLTDFNALKSQYDSVNLDFELHASSANDTEHIAYTTTVSTVTTNHYQQNITFSADTFKITSDAAGTVPASLSFGGDLDSSVTDGMSVSEGLFSAGISKISLAEFTVGVSGLDFTTTHNTFSHLGPLDSSTITLGLSIIDAGAGSGTTPVAFHAGDSHVFADVEFTTKLSWADTGAFVASSVDGVQLTGAFTLEGALSDSAGLAIAFTPTATALNGSTPVTLTGDDLALLQKFETTAASLLKVDGGELLSRLSDVASGLDALFQSNVFDVSLPFLDNFHLSDVLSAYQAISDALLEPMHVDLGVIGLTDGNDTSVSAQIALDGIVADPTTGKVFTDDALGSSFDFDVQLTSSIQLDNTTGTPVKVAPHTDVFTVVVDRPTGGFADLDALVAAITKGLQLNWIGDGATGKPDITLASFISVVAVRGALDFRGVGIDSFKIAETSTVHSHPDTGTTPVGAPDGGAATKTGVLEAFGIESANNSVGFAGSTAHDLSGTTIDFGSWQKYFPISLDVARTVTFSDGSTSTVDYKTLTLEPPAGGWTDATMLADRLQDIFGSAGIHVTVTGDSGALHFAMDTSEQSAAKVDYATGGKTVTGTSFTFAIDSSRASVASGIDALESFVNGELQDKIDGASLDIDVATGQLVLDLPDVMFGYVTSFAKSLAIDMGDLGEVQLAATMSLLAQMDFNLDVGVDLSGLLGKTSTQSLSDFLYVKDVGLAANVGASAHSITGSADLGIIEVTLGANDPTQNNLDIGAKLEVSLVGQSTDGSYSDQISFHQLLTGANSVAGIENMIGTLDLTGTVTSSDVTDTNSYFVLAEIGDVTVATGIPGLEGVAADAIKSFSAGLTDLNHPTQWVVAYDSPIAQSLAGLRGGDLVDTLYNSLVLVNQVLDGIGFMHEEIPVLGISIADALNFSQQMADELGQFKSDPNTSLASLSASLSQAFGLDPSDLQLVWDGTEQTFYVALSMDFLKGADLSYDFSLDLQTLLQDATSNPVVSQLLNVVSSLADVSGSGTIVLDADVAFNVTFGIDLSHVFGDSDPVVEATTALTALAGVSQITFNSVKSGQDGKDLLISVGRATAGGATTTTSIKVELDGAQTVGDAVKDIWEAIKPTDDVDLVLWGTVNGTPTTITVDGSTDFTDAGFGTTDFHLTNIEVVDSQTQAAGYGTDYSPLADLFGAQTADVTATGGVIVGTDSFDPTAAQSFALKINGAEPVTVSIAADDGRTDQQFIDAVNAALQASFVGRVDSGLGFIGTIPLSQLVVASLDTDGKIELTATNFSEAIGKGALSFALTGTPNGATSTVTVGDIGGSNLASALGFAPDRDGQPPSAANAVEGATLGTVDGNSGVSAFFVTGDGVDIGSTHLAGTGISLDFKAGIDQGLNMTLAFGPLNVSVIHGTVLIGGDGANGDAYLHFGLNGGADGDTEGGPDAASRLYLSVISDIVEGTAHVSDLFALSADAELSIILPLQDSLGFMHADGENGNGIFITGTLFKSGGTNGFSPTGALPALFNHEALGLTTVVDLPSLDDIISSINPLAILNDPLLLANGLDTIFATIDRTLRAVINAMDVPIVGDNLNQGLGIFNSIRQSLIQPLLVAASTPKADGTLPTSVDLLTGVVNKALDDLLGLDESTRLINATLVTDGSDPALVAEISFNATVFEAALNVGFDLGIPGLALDVGNASALMFDVLASVHIAFGIDKKGFFFLNDTDEPEIELNAYVTTSQGFTATAVLGLIGFQISTNELDTTLPGDVHVYGAYLGADLKIDLFTTLGTPIVAGGALDEAIIDMVANSDNPGHSYENQVHLNQLSTSKAAGGEGSKTVEISGSFAVEVNLHLNTTLVNPSDNQPITALPAAFADLVFKADYEVGSKLNIETLEFANTGIYAGDFLVENVLPIIDQIRSYVDPINKALSFLQTKIGGVTLEEIIEDALGGSSNPEVAAALFIFHAAEELDKVVDFIDDLSANHGKVYFGTFSLLSSTSATGVVDTTNAATVGHLKASVAATGSANVSLINKGPGLKFEFPIFTDPSNVLNLLTGNLAAVNLFDVNVTLLDFTLNIDLVNDIRAALGGVPASVISALLGGLNANFYVHAEAGITVGFDLYGVSEFLGSGDAADIVDGIYFDSNRPLFELDASFGVRVGINLGIISAGFELDGYFGVSINLNDPNDDGRLRLSEIAYVVTEAGDPISGVLHLFEGDIKGGMSLSVYFELDFFFFSISDSFTVFSFDFTAHFGYSFPPHYFDTVDGVTTLNVGAKAGNQVGGDTVDGDDVISFSGHEVYINGNDAGAIGDSVVIYAGDGNNTIDLSGLDAGVTFQVFSGSGNDHITLGGAGGVVSTGDGDDIIDGALAAPSVMFSAMAFGASAPYPGAPPATPNGGTATPPAGTAGSAYSQIKTSIPTKADLSQTVLILTGAGSDTVDVHDSTADTVVVSGDMEITSDDGKRVALSDWLQSEYQGGAPVMSEVLDKLGDEMASYTARSQSTGDDSPDTITTGSGNDLIFSENGNDTINSGDGDDIIFAGGGDDYVNAGAGNDYVEGGAGADIIIGGEGNDVLLGWGRYDETTTAVDYADALGLNITTDATTIADFAALVSGSLRDDGGDWIEGNDGNDIIHGNSDADILQGNAGDDTIFGGSGSDIVAGGDVTVTPQGGTPLHQSVNLTGVYTVSAVLGDDGADHLMGQDGADVLIGGGGDDVLEGQGGNNILIGDFADLTLSGDTTLLSANATNIDSTLQGDDTLIGGALVDIMMGNGGRDILSGDMGQNTLIGDNALLSSTNLYQGITGMRSLLGTEDDADTIYTGLTTSLIVAGKGGMDGGTPVGDAIYTGLAYDSELTGSALDTAAQRMIIFADYGDLSGPIGTLGTLTTVFSVGDDDTVITTGGDDIIFGGVGDDTISSGLGDDIVFGDTGTYRATPLDPRHGFEVSSDHAAITYTDAPQVGDVTYAGSLQTGDSSTIIGDDTINGGDGNNLVIGGGGADHVVTGTGVDVILGDLGSIRVYSAYDNTQPAPTDAPQLTATASQPVSGDDDWGDEIIAGLGDDIVIGASGSDVIAGGATSDTDAGRLYALGDFGSVSVRLLDGNGARVFDDLASGNDAMATAEVLSLESSNTDQGADDALYGGADGDVLIGGSGADTIYGYGGDDVIFGDHASFVYDSTINGYAASGTATGVGGDDLLYGGDDDDVVVGGFGDDSIEGGAGNDLLAGDWATVRFGDARSLTTQATGDGGVDTIHGGLGDDVIVGGREGDDLWGDEGSNVVFGDYADLTWENPTGQPSFALETIVLAGLEITADDTIHTNGATEASTDGNSIAVGGRGADTIYGGEANDFVLGDWGVFTLQDANAHPGVSAFDRIISIESTQEQIRDNDTISTFSGRDIIIAGDGDDTIDGGAGQDLIAGDQAIFTDYHNGYQLLESRFPFEGGDDVIRTGPGNDMVISGYFNFGTPGAGDLIYGDTIEDFLMAGAGSLYIHGNLVERFNYLGIAPADNISNQQLSNSAGVQLRPNYERDFTEEAPTPSPFDVTERDLANMITFAHDSPIAHHDSGEFLQLDALLAARILSDDVLRLIDLYRHGAISLKDLDAELREALVLALFDTYGYRLPESVAEMLDRYLELLYQRLDIDPGTANAAAVSPDTDSFEQCFAAAFEDA